MRVQHQTAQGEKTYGTKYECYNLLNCEFEEQYKDACFFFIKLPVNKWRINVTNNSVWIGN